MQLRNARPPRLSAGGAPQPLSSGTSQPHEAEVTGYVNRDMATRSSIRQHHCKALPLPCLFNSSMPDVGHLALPTS